jgi:hypothetical protein
MNTNTQTPGDKLAKRIEEITCKHAIGEGLCRILNEALAEYHRELPAVSTLTDEQLADGWVEWHGGECPVFGRSKPSIRLRDGSTNNDLPASSWSWGKLNLDSGGQIIAYLPDPYEALKKAQSEGKVIQESWEPKMDWHDLTDPIFNMHPSRYRVKPEPEKWAAEKAAFANGKPVQFRNENWKAGDWASLPRSREIEEQMAVPGYEWRVKPEPVMVELGHEDVKPGDAIRVIGMRSWRIVGGAGEKGIYVGTDSFTYAEAKEKLEISRDGGKTWGNCEKEAK